MLPVVWAVAKGSMLNKAILVPAALAISFFVPWLVTPDGHVLTESSAIALHIADSHPQAGLIGPLGSAERAHAYRWMAFLATNIYKLK